MVGPSPEFHQIRTTNKNGWSPLQTVSPSPVFHQIRTTDQNDWTNFQKVSPFAPDQNHWWNSQLSLQWVGPCPVTPVFQQIRADEIGWTCIQRVSPSSVSCSDQNFWQEWLNTLPDSESPAFPVTCADQNHWWEWLNLLPESESLSCDWADQNHWLMGMATHAYSGWVTL